jgi:hypothetical protein
LEEEKAKAVDIAVFPCVLNIMPKMVFNQKDPIICGVEVIDGILKVIQSKELTAFWKHVLHALNVPPLLYLFIIIAPLPSFRI